LTADEEDENSEAYQKKQRLCSQLQDLIPTFGQLRYIRDNISYADLGTRMFI
jgi:hypothetical protein